MHHHVYFHCPSTCKSFSTNLTLIRFFSRMTPQMASQPRIMLEHSSTELTRIIMFWCWHIANIQFRSWQFGNPCFGRTPWSCKKKRLNTVTLRQARNRLEHLGYNSFLKENLKSLKMDMVLFNLLSMLRGLT